MPSDRQEEDIGFNTAGYIPINMASTDGPIPDCRFWMTGTIQPRETHHDNPGLREPRLRAGIVRTHDHLRLGLDLSPAKVDLLPETYRRKAFLYTCKQAPHSHENHKDKLAAQSSFKDDLLSTGCPGPYYCRELTRSPMSQIRICANFNNAGSIHNRKNKPNHKEVIFASCDPTFTPRDSILDEEENTGYKIKYDQRTMRRGRPL